MIKIEVSLGELVDRITILEIKQSMISDKDKLEHIETELDELGIVLRRHLDIEQIEVPEMLRQKLYSVNLSIWNILNDQRKKERKLEFDEDYIELSRAVYQMNDLRFFAKGDITELTNAEVQEQKNYA